MSEVPKGWSRVALEDVADVLDFEREPINSTDRDSRINGKTVSDLYPYYGATGQVGFIDAFRSEGQRVLLGEDAAPFLDPIKDKAYLANGRFWVNNHAHILAGAAGLVDNKFLCHQLNTVDYHPFVTGSTRLKLTSSAMKQIPMVVAPSAEQTRIVTKLEELLSDLDAGVAELKAAQKKLAQYRQSLLKAAVDGSLTAEWRKNNQPSETGTQLLERILKERRARWEAKQLAKFQEQGKTPPKDWQKKYPEPVLPSTTDLPELPLWWTLATTGLIAESIVPNRDKPLTFTGHIPWITTPDFERTDLHLKKSISGFGLSENECEMYRARVVPSQSVIMTCVGRFGLSAVLDVRAVINQQLHAFIPESGIRAEYLAFVIQAQRNWLERNATSTTIAYLNKEKCESLPVPLPPVNEQDAVLNLLKPQLASIKVQLRNVGFSLKQAAAQRQNILRAAFAGQLVPQDPNDEPASILLERIRTERATRDAVRKPSRRKMKETRNA